MSVVVHTERDCKWQADVQALRTAQVRGKGRGLGDRLKSKEREEKKKKATALNPKFLHLNATPPTDPGKCFGTATWRSIFSSRGRYRTIIS